MTTEKPRTNNQKSRIAVTREGRYFLGIAIGLIVLSLLKGMNLVLLLACLMLAGWFLNALLAGRRLRHLRAQRSIDRPVFAETPFNVHLMLTNMRPKPVPGVRIEDRGPQHALAWYLSGIAGRETQSFQQRVTLPLRGRYSWEPLLASSGYPFGLVRRSRILAPGEELIVLPRLGRLHRRRLRSFLTPASYTTAEARGAARRNPTAQSEFHGLRDFRSGDSPRWIHWRTSARCGELMVREFEDVPTDDLILIVDPEVSSDRREDGPAPLEALISMAATICWEWCRECGHRLTLAVVGPEPIVLDGLTGPEHAVRTLECLAVQAGRPARSTAPLDTVARLVLPPGPILLLSTRPSGLGDLLALRLNRPVASLDLSALPDIDFYEGPLLHNEER
jgi:uncharacterized protein (DUF58 family)